MTRPTARLIRTGLAFTLMLSLAAGFAALGVWQLDRRVWKHDLIERVEARIHAEPVAPPRPLEWGSFVPADLEYTRVTMTGAFGEGEALVKAVTALGGGYWVLAPFRTEDGFTVLVNRGFVPNEQRDAARRAGGTTVTGLARLPEPDGAFLRANDPANGRWFSRDVEGIAAALNLGTVAPYFVDQDRAAAGTGAPAADAAEPVGGLTVVAFPDSHLVYALTWFALCLMSLFGAALVVLRFDTAKDERKVPRSPSAEA